jgi:hypothetical protein
LTRANSLLSPDLLSQMRPEAFADFLGVSLKIVQRNIDRGMPVALGGGKGFAKSIPVVAAVEWLGRNPAKRRGRPPNVSRRDNTPSAPPSPVVAIAPSKPSQVDALSLASQHGPGEGKPTTLGTTCSVSNGCGHMVMGVGADIGAADDAIIGLARVKGSRCNDARRAP